MPQKIKRTFDDKSEYLPSVRKTLEVSEASQMLVFPNLFNVDLRTITVVERVRTLVMRSRTVS